MKIRQFTETSVGVDSCLVTLDSCSIWITKRADGSAEIKIEHGSDATKFIVAAPTAPVVAEVN